MLGEREAPESLPGAYGNPSPVPASSTQRLCLCLTCSRVDHTPARARRVRKAQRWRGLRASGSRRPKECCGEVGSARVIRLYVADSAVVLHEAARVTLTLMMQLELGHFEQGEVNELVRRV